MTEVKNTEKKKKKRRHRAQKVAQHGPLPEGIPAWAIPEQLKPKKRKRRDSDDDDDSTADEEEGVVGMGGPAQDAINQLLRTTAKLGASGHSGRLPARTLTMAFRRDINAQSRSSLPASCVEFHPDPQIPTVLVAAPDGYVKLFKMKHGTSKLLQSIHLPNMKAKKCHFDPSGAKIYVSGGKAACCIIDTATYEHRRVTAFIHNHKFEKNLPTFNVSQDGKYLSFLNPTGRCFLVSSQTFTTVAELKMGEALCDVTFDHDNTNYMYLCGGGKVYTWDLRNTMEPLSVLRDEGALDSRRIAVSHSHVAVGSDVGIVNIYNKPMNGCFTSMKQSPLKVFTNITYAIDHLGFNHDGQLLFLGCQKMGQHRMAHMGTMTAFENYPGALNNRTITTFAFSPDSKWLALASKEGRVMLSKLSYYHSAHLGEE